MKAFSLVSSLALVASLAGLSPAAHSAAVIEPGFTNGSTLPRCDDCADANTTPLGFAINYFGFTGNSAYVSTNGYVTFQTPSGAYTPFGLLAYTGQPLIAPFYSDVDTRGAASGLVTYGTGTFAGKNAFGVTWNNVGYFGAHDDKLNTFQLLLVEQSAFGVGAFDIYFNYSSIQWETGDANGGSDGLGGNSAAAGYSAGTGVPGTAAQLPGSQVNGAFIDGGPFALAQNTNDGVIGQYLFQVRNGAVVVTPPVVGEVPEPGSLALLGLGLAGLASIRKRKQA